MNRGILAIFDKELNYAARFIDYIEKTRKNTYSMYSFTDKLALLEFVNNRKVDILLVSESSMCEEMPKIECENFFVLKELEEHKYSYYSIDKYQSADRIFDEILGYLPKTSTNVNCAGITGNKQLLYGVYSPINRCGKTSFSLALSRYFSEKNRVLYISFDEYSGIREMVDTSNDLSDIIYHFINNKDSFIEKLNGLKVDCMGFDLIPPMLFSEDIRSIDTNIWIGMLRAIEAKGIYDVIILDLSDMVGDVIKIIEECDEIYMPIIDDVASDKKIREFEEVLTRRREEKMLEKIKRVKVPMVDLDYDVKNDVEKIVNGRIKDYIKCLLENDVY